MSDEYARHERCRRRRRAARDDGNDAGNNDDDDDVKKSVGAMSCIWRGSVCIRYFTVGRVDVSAKFDVNERKVRGRVTFRLLFQFRPSYDAGAMQKKRDRIY